MKRRERLTAMAIAMALTLTTGSTVFADSKMNDSISIAVEKPMQMAKVARASNTIEGNRVSVSGGTLWVTWKSGVAFRANYTHKKKTHRCSVSNNHNVLRRSEWTPKGITAISPWLDQTLSGNRAYAATK